MSGFIKITANFNILSTKGRYFIFQNKSFCLLTKHSYTWLQLNLKFSYFNLVKDGWLKNFPLEMHNGLLKKFGKNHNPITRKTLNVDVEPNTTLVLNTAS